MYLLQLVQALKYENFDEILAAYEREKGQSVMMGGGIGASTMPPATPDRKGSESSSHQQDLSTSTDADR